jgi:hypothetical protein
MIVIRFPAVSMWLDHPRVGCGERCYFVIKTGRKWVTLHNPATLTTVSVPLDTYRNAPKTELDAVRLFRAHSRQRKLWRKLGLRVDATARAIGR